MNLDGIYGNERVLLLSLLLVQKLKMEIQRTEKKTREAKKKPIWKCAFFLIGFRYFFWRIHATRISEICGLVSEMIQAVVVDGDFLVRTTENETALEKWVYDG